MVEYINKSYNTSIGNNNIEELNSNNEPFLRFVDHNFAPDHDKVHEQNASFSTPYKHIFGIGKLMYSALYCDYILTEKSIDWNDIFSYYIEQKGYFVTHLPLVVEMANISGCDLNISGKNKIDIKKGIQYIIDNETENLDLFYEAIAINYHFYDQQPSKSQIDLILSSQNQDGGWSAKQNQPSNAHATMLAVWILIMNSNKL